MVHFNQSAFATAAVNASMLDQHDQLKFALQAADMYVWERDTTTREVKRFGDPADVLGVDVDTIDDFLAHVHEDERETVRTAISGAINEFKPFEVEFRIIREGKPDIWIRDTGKHLKTAHKTRFVGVCMNVTKEVEARKRAEHLAMHDSLTQLPNRLSFRQQLDAALLNLPDARSLYICLIDIDGFKSINDQFGHAAGDQLLIGIAQLLQETLGQYGVISRLGGDEFAAMMHEMDVEQFHALRQAVIRRLGRPLDIGGQSILVRISMGIASAPANGCDTETLMHRADLALYKAKTGQSHGMCFYQKGLEDAEMRQRQIEKGLRSALVNEEFYLAYQPIIKRDDRCIAGVEALIRWQHPVLGEVSPAEFIPLAERTGLIVNIGNWVLRTACKAALDWPDLTVAVNVSPLQFRDPGFVGFLATTLERTGLDPQRLELEVTEGVLLQDADKALEIFQKIKAMGVRIAMDDFGTGYSSLSYISRFAFDKIKIDGSFIQSLGKSSEAAAVVQAVLNLGNTLDININAEGVETIEQLTFLDTAGCDLVQGYYFSPPVAGGEIQGILDKTAMHNSEQ